MKKLLSFISLSPMLVFGSGGIDKVNTFLQNLSTALYAQDMLTTKDKERL